MRPPFRAFRDFRGKILLPYFQLRPCQTLAPRRLIPEIAAIRASRRGMLAVV